VRGGIAIGGTIGGVLGIDGSRVIHASRARGFIEGAALVKCIIEKDGRLAHCSLIKGLRLMDGRFSARSPRGAWHRSCSMASR
jgi:hypothetical protein